MSETPPPGWYPDPTAPGMVRWWSGWSWVGEPMTPEAAAANARGLRDIGELVQDAWAPIGRRMGDLLSMAALLFVPLVLVLGPIAWIVLQDVDVVERRVPVRFGADGTMTQTEYDLVGFGLAQVLVVTVGALALSVAVGFLWLGAARLLVAEAQHVREPWQASLRAGVARFWRVVGTVILMGLLVLAAMVVGMLAMGLSALFPPLLIVTLPAFLVGLFYVGLRLQLAPLVAAVAPRTVSPISATWEIVGTNLLGVLGRLFVLWLISSAGSFVTSIPGGILQVVLPPVVGLLASVALNGVVQVLLTVYVLSGSILIWRDLGGEVEPVVAPVAGGDGPVIGGSIAG